MTYNDLINNSKNMFYPVKEKWINDAEKNLNMKFPDPLKEVWRTVGNGFLRSAKNYTNSNTNRIMDPYAVEDFRLEKGLYEEFLDYELIRDDEKYQLIFFEIDWYTHIGIGICENNKNKIYYYDTVIADSIEEFLFKMSENDSYYESFVEEERTGELVSIYSFELPPPLDMIFPLGKKDSLIQSLGLPTGCLVIYKENKLLSISDKDEKDLL